MSEALGNVGAEGKKKVRVTQTDRTAAKYLGGAPFSMMQKVDPQYAKAQATWGVKTPGAAKNITNQADEGIIFSTLIGSPTQHRSNELIFDKLYNAFKKSVKEGNLNEELRTKFNRALEPLFGEGADILDPKLRKEIDTFEKRAVVGNLLLGEGLGGATRGGSIIPGRKIMEETTEPMLRDVDTFSIGPRLFTLNKGIVTRPDLHPAFPEILQGEDLNQLFVPVPNEIALLDFNADFRKRTGRKKPGYYDLTMTPPGQPYPTQDITEEYLTHLQKEGYAAGGLARMAEGGTPPPPRKSILELQPLTDAAAALQEAYKTEKKTYGQKGAAMDILNRGFVSDVLGGAVDLANLPLQGLDYVQSKIPFLSKPASVTDPKGDRVPKFPLSTDKPFAGSDAFRDVFKRAGITSGTERPIAETTTSLVAPFAPSAAGKVAKVAKASAPYAGKLAQEFAEKTQMGFPLQMNVMKPKGGNWLAGSTEKLTDPFKYKYAGGKSTQETLDEMNRVYNPEALALMSEETRQSVTRHLPQLQREAVLEKWVDQKLGKYIKNEMATPEDPIRLGIERRAVEAEALKELNNKRLAKMEADIQRAKAEGKDTTLSENDLAAAREKFDDEYTIASRGLYHRTAPEGGWTGDNVWEPETVLSRRVKEGFPERGMGKTPASTAWEIEADAEIRPLTAGYISKAEEPATLGGKSIKNIQEENPWLSKVDPETKVYSFSDNALDVGLEFRHMIDEVKAAMDPASNLPKSLRISPKDLEKMTVDDVSALSGKISAWRDVQKTKADLQLANNPAVHTFKEYPPENNPKGVSWRQIKRPEGMPDDEAEKYVREATKYEGDIMRHCVGGAGHCEPLLRGDVELYTLRDAKGEPHVTIEVEPGQWNWQTIQESGGSPLEAVTEAKNRMGITPGNEEEFIKNLNGDQRYEKEQELRNLINEIYTEKVGKSPPAKILEIKGKNNRKPNDEYIPFVQDFIRSGQWSDVGDIGNTGMRATRDVFSDSELRKLKELGYKPNPVLSGEEIQKLHNAIVPEGQRLKYSPEGNIIGGEGNYAKGGAVSNNDLESRMNAMLAKGYAKGGAVNSGSLEDKMNKMLAAAYAPKNMADGGFTKVGSFKIGGRISLIKH
jgi:hypothetical protein